MTHDQWIGVTWLVIKWSIGLGIFGIVIASGFCKVAKMNLVQEDEQEKMFDPMAPRGLSNETYITSIFDEESADCETVISRTVVRV